MQPTSSLHPAHHRSSKYIKHNRKHKHHAQSRLFTIIVTLCSVPLLLSSLIFLLVYLQRHCGAAKNRQHSIICSSPFAKSQPTIFGSCEQQIILLASNWSLNTRALGWPTGATVGATGRGWAGSAGGGGGAC